MTERELHLTERPATFKQVVGQKEAVSQLTGMGKSGTIPHCLLFTGPSGCGKTTLARIIRRKLKCSDTDFTETNAASNRGIDGVRDIQKRVNLAPMDGPCRVWLIDECHQLTGEAQGAFLKLLEEPPEHVYFMLATTNPEKLRAAIRTRCTEIKVRPVGDDDMMALVARVHRDHMDTDILPEVCDKITEMSEGSVRKALVLLQQIMNVDPEKQVDYLQKTDAKVAAFEIARAIMANKRWSDVASIIKGCEEDPEGIRWMILSYFSKVALGGGKNSGRAVQILEEFSEPFFNTKKAGLVIAAYNALHPPE